MMKKIIAVILSLAMLLCAASVMAEATQTKTTLGSVSINGAFTLQCGIPEGYELAVVSPESGSVTANTDQMIAVFQSQDPQAPVMMLSIAYDEQYSDVDRMNDLSQEDLDRLEETYIEEDPEVEITYGETGYGTLLLIARHETEDMDYIAFFSIYKGYCVEFVLIPSEQAEDKNLTAEQLQLCVQFLTDVDFIPGIIPADGSRVSGQTFTANVTDYKAETNEIELELKREIILDAEEIKALQEGDILTIGAEEITVETLQAIDEETITVNDEYELRISGDEARAYLYEHEYMETFATILVPVEDDLVFLDGIDPESGEILDQPTEHTAAEFIGMLTQENTVAFDADNISATFDDEGRLITLERFYTPWQ